jgi:hypothetical protein
MTDSQPMSAAARKPARARVFACPSCGGTVTVRAVGISVTAFCTACGSAIDVANENLAVIAKAQQHMHASLIAIGARGTLAGTEWEVIGLQNRSDASGRWQWTEYLLFNPYRGFRFLAQDHGHWTLYCMLRQDVGDPKKVTHDGRPYKLFNIGPARTDYVLGEFYWRAKAGDTVSVSEYIAPPYILSREENDSEIVWSRGIYLDPGIVAAAFKLEAVPARSGIAPHQPSPFEPRLPGIRRVAVFGVLALLVLHMVDFGQDRGVPVFAQSFVTSAGDKGRTLTTDPFTVPGKGGNLQIVLQAPSLMNDWLAADMSLVDQQNDRGFSVAREVDYYQGSDSDGPWTEGSHAASASFASVPGGTYRLLITPDAGIYTTPNPYNRSLAFQVIVRRHVPSWATFWVCLLLILAYPGIVKLRHNRFETRRWENSELENRP